MHDIKNINFVCRYNRLSSVPQSLSNCVHMDEYNIEGNNISQLPVRNIVSSTPDIHFPWLFGDLYISNNVGLRKT